MNEGQESDKVLGFKSLLEILGVVALSLDGSAIASAERTFSSFGLMLSANAKLCLCSLAAMFAFF